MSQPIPTNHVNTRFAHAHNHNHVHFQGHHVAIIFTVILVLGFLMMLIAGFEREVWLGVVGGLIFVAGVVMIVIYFVRRDRQKRVEQMSSHPSATFIPGRNDDEEGTLQMNYY
mgnify:CR=1 FL=1